MNPPKNNNSFINACTTHKPKTNKTLEGRILLALRLKGGYTILSVVSSLLAFRIPPSGI